MNKGICFASTANRKTYRWGKKSRDFHFKQVAIKRAFEQPGFSPDPCGLKKMFRWPRRAFRTVEQSSAYFYGLQKNAQQCETSDRLGNISYWCKKSSHEISPWSELVLFQTWKYRASRPAQGSRWGMRGNVVNCIYICLLYVLCRASMMFTCIKVLSHLVLRDGCTCEIWVVGANKSCWVGQDKQIGQKISVSNGRAQSDLRTRPRWTYSRGAARSSPSSIYKCINEIIMLVICGIRKTL